jgi:hypothetical protein
VRLPKLQVSCQLIGTPGEGKDPLPCFKENLPMKTAMIVALALALPLQAATAAGPDAKAAPRDVAGQKIDSGLGELPHYRLWADPSGKNPMASAKATKVGNSLAGNDTKAHVADAKPASASTQVAGLR